MKGFLSLVIRGEDRQSSGKIRLLRSLLSTGGGVNARLFGRARHTRSNRPATAQSSLPIYGTTRVSMIKTACCSTTCWCNPPLQSVLFVVNLHMESCLYIGDGRILDYSLLPNIQTKNRIHWFQRSITLEEENAGMIRRITAALKRLLAMQACANKNNRMGHILEIAERVEIGVR